MTSTLVRLTAFFAIAASAGVLPLVQAQASDTPTPYEIEFWRSVDKYDSAQAYQAYLDRFPRGAFSPLAKIAISKLGSGTSVATPLRSLLDAGKLAILRQQTPEAASLDFRVGSRFVGPGTLTVGQWGAKKQVLLPSGTWITLAAYDHSSSDPIVSELTTVAFGQFDGLALKNSLVVTFVKRSQATSTWPSASACDAAVPDAKYQQVQAYMRVRWCATLRTWTQSNEASLVSAELASRISKSVVILGATSEEHKTISEVYVSERGPSYIRYVMLRTADTLNLLVARPVGPSDIKFPSAADPETQRRVANLAHFSYHASLALRREYPALDLSEDSPKDETQIENAIGRAE